MTRFRGIPVALLGAGAVYEVLVREPRPRSALLIAVFVALLLLPVIIRHPTASLCVLLLMLVVQLVLLGFLYKVGVPVAVVRQLGLLKDVLLAGLALRALQDRRQQGGRLQRVDVWIIAYLGVVTAYLVLPSVLSGLTSVPFTPRLTAWRSNVFFLTVLLSVRWIRPGALSTRALRWTVLFGSALVAAGAGWEYFDTPGWRQFLYQDIAVQAYLADALGTPVANRDFTTYSSDGSIRAGSILREPVFAAFLLLPAFFVAISRIASRRPLPGIALTCLLGVGLVCTSTRSALLVGLGGASLVAHRMLRSGRYLKLFVPILMVALILSPVFIAQTSVISRIGASISGTDSSTQAHRDHLDDGVKRAIDHPLGTGLATGGGTGQRFSVRNAFTSENAYLQVIIETGAIALVLFIGILVLLTRELIALPRSDPGLQRDRAAALAVMVAMVLGGWAQTVWLLISVGVYAVVVLTLPRMILRERAASGEPESHPAQHQPTAPPQVPARADSRDQRRPPAAQLTISHDPAAGGR